LGKIDQISEVKKIGKMEKKNLMLNLASFNCKENTTTRKEKRVGSGLVS
jgi:hypothetical protein